MNYIELKHSAFWSLMEKDLPYILEKEDIVKGRFKVKGVQEVYIKNEKGFIVVSPIKVTVLSKTNSAFTIQRIKGRNDY